MNLQHERIAAHAQALQLDTLKVEWPDIAAQAATQEASSADFLEQIYSQRNKDKVRFTIYGLLPRLPTTDTQQT